MTNELSMEETIEILKEKRMEINYQVNGTTQFSNALDFAIKALEEQKWIPVSEPPKKNGEYLVTVIDEDSDGNKIYTEEKLYWTGMHWIHNFLIVDNVIAYMPMPQPYKGGKMRTKVYGMSDDLVEVE